MTDAPETPKPRAEAPPAITAVGAAGGVNVPRPVGRAGEGALTAYRRLLSNPRFRRLWFSQFVSGIGDWLVIGLLLPLVSSLSGGSSFAVAGILVAKIVPALFLSSLTGVFVDRFDRRKLMITTDLVRAVLALGLFFTNSLAAIYLIVLMMETASLFFYPAKNALIPYLVDADEIAEANGLSYTTQQASTLVGLTMSAAILAAFERIVRLVLDANLIGLSKLVGLFSPALLGPKAGVTLDSLTFLISAFSIWGIHIVARPSAYGSARFDLSLVGKDVRESFVFMRSHRELRAFLSTIFVAILGGGAIVTVGLSYIQTSVTGGLWILNNIPALKTLTATPQTFFLVCLALGMATAAVIVPRLAHRVPLQLLFVGSVTLFGGVLIAFSATTRYLAAALLAVLAGACIAAVTVSGNTYVVRTTADEIRGRVFTALESVVKVALLVSLMVMAPLNDLVAVGVRKLALSQDLPIRNVALWAPRVTLWLAAAMVFGAAFHGFRNLAWRPNGKTSGSESPRGGSPDAEAVEIALPPAGDELAGLRAGDAVLLSGPVYTARDATHAKLLEELDATGELPFGLKGQVLFYAGPTPATEGRPVGAIGPTTAKRMDAATPRLLAAGIAATIGKGARSAQVRAACAEHGTVYFAAVGGAAALLGHHVTEAETVAWSELGTEALVRLNLDRFPAFVAIDARGSDLYAEAAPAWRASAASLGEQRAIHSTGGSPE